MRTIFYFCLLVAATGFHGLDAMGPPPRPSGGPPRPSGRPPGPPAPPGNKGTTADYGWTDDDYDENEGWVSCGCHDAPSCRKCGTQQHLCNGDCSWSYGGCYRKGPRPTNPGPRPTRPPHPPTGETPVSMPSRPPPTWETPVSIPGSRPPPTYETPVHIGTSTPGPGGNGTSTEEAGTCNTGDACKGCGITSSQSNGGPSVTYCCADNCNVNSVSVNNGVCKCSGSGIISAEDTKAPDTETTVAPETEITQASQDRPCNTGDACKDCGTTSSINGITYCCADFNCGGVSFINGTCKC